MDTADRRHVQAAQKVVYVNNRRDDVVRQPVTFRFQHRNPYIEVAIVDPQLLGFKMQIFAQVKMTTLSDDERAAFHKAIMNIPEILECWTVFGEMASTEVGPQ